MSEKGTEQEPWRDPAVEIPTAVVAAGVMIAIAVLITVLIVAAAILWG